MGFTFACDVPGFNYGSAPAGMQLCGYDTGSAGVAWTPAMWAAHPGAVHIDQAPDTAALRTAAPLKAGHVTSDVLDVENGAVPVGSPLLAVWVRGALASFAAASRPGQRRPVLYQSASNVTANVNALIAGGVTSGAGLWIAKWDGNTAADIAALAAASGPFPVTGFQYADAGPYDTDVFSTAWLSGVSGDGWVFGPCRSVRFWPGRTTFGCSGYSPGVPEPAGVADYEIAVVEGRTFPGRVIARYPAYVPKDVSTSLFVFEGHGLSAGTAYIAGVRARAAGGAHAGPWVTGTFTTAA